MEKEQLIREMATLLGNSQHSFMDALDKAIVANGANTHQKSIHDNYVDIARWLNVCEKMNLTEPRSFRLTSLTKM